MAEEEKQEERPVEGPKKKGCCPICPLPGKKSYCWICCLVAVLIVLYLIATYLL